MKHTITTGKGEAPRMGKPRTTGVAKKFEYCVFGQQHGQRADGAGQGAHVRRAIRLDNSSALVLVQQAVQQIILECDIAGDGVVFLAQEKWIVQRKIDVPMAPDRQVEGIAGQ